jgi:hypothetical protein
MAKTRVVFNFDNRSLAGLQQLKEQTKVATLGDVVSDSLQISHALMTQAANGFSEVVVRNPKTNAERVMVIPNLNPANMTIEVQDLNSEDKPK